MIHQRICWVWIAAAILWALPAGAAPLRVTLETDVVAIAGTTPRGQIALLGVTREIGEDDFHTVRRHLQMLTDEDGDGVIRYPVKEGIPLRSLWAVADLTSGDYDTVAPTGFGAREVDWRGRGLERRHDGKDAIEDRRALLELLVIRPKVGAWALRLGDGDENDADGSIDGRIEGILEQMLPLTGDLKPPAVFQLDDLVMALDPTTMEITLVKVPAGR